jgi:creatinine amidohydrolase
MTSIRFAQTGAPELRRLASARAIALWPIGSTEQHGSHLATGFDLASATAVCERAAAETKATVVLLPGLPFGASEHWLSFGATLSLRPATLLAVLTDVVRSLDASGFRHLVIVNGHSGNAGVVTALLGEPSLFSVTIDVVSYWTMVDPERLAAACVTDQGGIGHAGEIETSVALELGGGLVVAEEFPAPAGEPMRPGAPGGPTRGGISRSPRPAVQAPNGIYGDPRHASATLGRLVISEAASALARHLDSL